MAGYRPKSLEELNNMYDKTMAAEKAIRKGTSLLENGNEKPFALSEEIQQDVSETEEITAQTAELSDAVSDFIAKYSEESAVKRFNAEMPVQKPRPQMTVLAPENPVQEAPVEKIDFPTVPRTAPQSAVTKEQPVRRADRDELMDEYMKIMSDEDNDEDDDIPGKKFSRKEKKKKKKKDKSFAESEITEATDEIPVEENFTEPEFQQEAEEAPVEDFYSQSEEIPSFFSEKEAETEEKNDFDFPDDYTPEWMDEDMTDGEDEHEPQKKGKKARKNKKDKKKNQNRQSFFAEAEDESEEDMESQKAEFEEAFADDEEEESPSVKEKKSGGKAFLRIFLSVLLVVLVITGGFATALKTVFSINTGKAFNDSMYIFTAYKSYPDLALNEGDLIITEKIYAEDGDVFAYIDYSEKTFEFGKRLDSITNDDGEVLLVTEKNASRVLVSRDDCKGVLKTVYPSVGKYVSIVTDNFVAVISVIAVAALAVVLILFGGLKTKKNDETEETERPENENEFENVFSTID